MLFYEEPSELELMDKYIQEQNYNLHRLINESSEMIIIEANVNAIKERIKKLIKAFGEIFLNIIHRIQKAIAKFKEKIKYKYDKNKALRTGKVTMMGYSYPVKAEVLIDGMGKLIDIGNTILKMANGDHSQKQYNLMNGILNSLDVKNVGFDGLVKGCLSTTSAYKLKLSDCNSVNDVNNKIINYYRTGHDSTTLEEKQKLTLDINDINKRRTEYDSLFDKAEKTADVLLKQYHQTDAIIKKTDELVDKCASNINSAKDSEINILQFIPLYINIATQAMTIATDSVMATMQAIVEMNNQDKIFYNYGKEEPEDNKNS